MRFIDREAEERRLANHPLIRYDALIKETWQRAGKERRGVIQITDPKTDKPVSVRFG